MANYYDMTGVIHSIGAVQNKQSRLGSPFQVQTIVLYQAIKNTEGKGFENYPTFEFTETRQLEGFKVGDEVNIAFDIKGVPYTNKQTGDTQYFTKLHGFRCSHHIVTPEQMQPMPQAQPAPAPIPEQQSVFAENDLPF